MSSPELLRSRARLVLSKLRLLVFFLLLAAVLNYLSCSERREFTRPSSIAPQVLGGPVQTGLNMQPFVIDYEGKKFEAFPKAHYVLAGLIVSHNDVGSITDAYHDSSSEDIRDICVVWGSNLASGIYRRMRYWSEPWTCFVEPKEQGDFHKFNQVEISNTHILTAKESVRDEVWKTKVGDQIVAEGVLIDYCPLGRRELMRSSSLIRNDTGNGACEVMYVNKFNIVRGSENVWHMIYEYSGIAFWLLLVLIPILFVSATWAESSAESSILREAEKRQRLKTARKPQY